jgi:hypothetical protein
VEQLWFFGNQTDAFLRERFSKHLREASVTIVDKSMNSKPGAPKSTFEYQRVPRKPFGGCAAVGPAESSSDRPIGDRRPIRSRDWRLPAMRPGMTAQIQLQ